MSPTTLALYQSADDTPLSPGGTLTVSVDNVEEALTELKAKGVKCLWEEHIDTPVCHFAIIFDPDDNQIGIHWRKDGTCG